MQEYNLTLSIRCSWSSSQSGRVTGTWVEILGTLYVVSDAIPWDGNKEMGYPQCLQQSTHSLSKSWFTFPILFPFYICRRSSHKHLPPTSQLQPSPCCLFLGNSYEQVWVDHTILSREFFAFASIFATQTLHSNLMMIMPNSGLCLLWTLMQMEAGDIWRIIMPHQVSF